jgi:hypothetical protein
LATEKWRNWWWSQYGSIEFPTRTNSADETAKTWWRKGHRNYSGI